VEGRQATEPNDRDHPMTFLEPVDADAAPDLPPDVARRRLTGVTDPSAARRDGLGAAGARGP
jgi:hypothetical protein